MSSTGSNGEHRRNCLCLSSDQALAVEARENPASSYSLLDNQAAGKTWLTVDAFRMADCAAAPALFYAVTYVPIGPKHKHLAAYFDRLMDRPSVARAIDEARPWFKFYPGRSGLARRFQDPETI